MPLGKAGSLGGKRILVAEDNFLQAADLADMIVKARGAVRCASSGREALNALEREKFDGVLLDVSLDDGTSVNVARMLERDGVPFIIVSGYEPAALPPEFRRAPYLAKPFSREQLINLLTSHFRHAASAA